MTNTTEDFCNVLCIFLSLKFGTNLLTPPTFIPHLSAISEQYFDKISELIPSFSVANGLSLSKSCNLLGYSRSTSKKYSFELFSRMASKSSLLIYFSFNQLNSPYGRGLLIPHPYRLFASQ